MEPVLSAYQLTKVYRIYRNPRDRIKEILFRRPYHEPMVALDHVSLEVPPGAALGVVGENGAGKSTLLGILAGVLKPTGGAVTRQGKVASILDLGGGFHSEFTGRQNIQMSAAMLGLGHKEIENSLDRIIDFSELHHFMDKPLKTYSAGMHIRLAFSVAVSVSPDLLVIDEVLAVGDAYFQKKCLDRLADFLENGGSIVFCSHSMYTVTQFCSQALWLRQGRAQAMGDAREVVAAYDDYTREKTRRMEQKDPFSRGAPAEGRSETPERSAAWIETCFLDGAHAGPDALYRLGDELLATVRFRTLRPEWKYHLGAAIDRNDHLTCYAVSTLSERLPCFSLNDAYEATFRIPRLPLLRGNYFLKLFLLDETGIRVLDTKTLPFTVVSEEEPWGVCYVPHEWKIH